MCISKNNKISTNNILKLRTLGVHLRQSPSDSSSKAFQVGVTLQEITTEQNPASELKESMCMQGWYEARRKFFIQTFH
jgi:hypothetical protein